MRHREASCKVRQSPRQAWEVDQNLLLAQASEFLSCAFLAALSNPDQTGDLVPVFGSVGWLWWAETVICLTRPPTEMCSGCLPACLSLFISRDSRT